MRKQSLLRNQLLLLGTATLIFLIFGLFTSIIMTQIDRSRFQQSPTVFLAKLMDELKPFNLSHEQSLELIKNANDVATFPVQVEIMNTQKAREVLSPGDNLPGNQYETVEYGPRDAWHFPSRLVKLSGDKGEYLSVIYRPRLTPMHRIFNLQTMVMMFSIFLAGLFTIFYMFYYMRKKARLAATIISQLRDGDLSARFPVGKMDEVGLLMREFNRMAEEIQTLVETIRHSELGRMRRLQELAHDLRTPVASLRNLLEMLQSHRGDISVNSQEEILTLSLKEVDYFQRLVEDLLFLAQVRDPKYAVVKTAVDLNGLLNDELDTLQARFPNIQVVRSEGFFSVRGDGHLLRRLFRNAFENAFSYARSKVEVYGQNHDGKVHITVKDDGPGFDGSTISTFGEKRGTRFVNATAEGRLSVGLGSVIMKEVTNVHCGNLIIRNGSNKGAEVEIVLPQDSVTAVKEEFRAKISSPR